MNIVCSDGFMNHSCSPNCWCPGVYETPDLICYDAWAVKDIHPGDEITCDYALFDYECEGHEIESCGCGADNCRGEMLGFKALSLEAKARVMHQCDKEILDKFFDDNPSVVLLRSQLPEGVGLAQDEFQNSTWLVATREFHPSEVVYMNRATIIAKADFENKSFIVELDNRYTLLNHSEHFIHRPDHFEFLGFDHFQDHGCEPNTEQVYHSLDAYTVRATRTILPGEKLLIDYNKLDNQFENTPSVHSIRFQCKCGSKMCRGLIVA